MDKNASTQDPAGGEALAQFVHHVSFTVPDLESGRHFYQDILGLAQIPRPDLGFPGIWLRAGACEVHILAPPVGTADIGQPPPAPVGIASHVAFRVRDYENTMARLKAAGLDVVEGRFGIHQMWVQDPGGNVIEFIPG